MGARIVVRLAILTADVVGTAIPLTGRLTAEVAR
jgi:hypothetical protein